MALTPFQAPLARERDKDAWVGGVRRKPTWTRMMGLLDRAGFHELIRAAQLPLKELEHMGAELSPDGILARKGKWVEESEAVMLLGRIAWDAKWGNAGAVWDDSLLLTQRVLAADMGRQVVEEWFTS